MEALQIMPTMAQNQSRFNLGEYAEEAAIIQDEPTVQPSVNFLEANTDGKSSVSCPLKPSDSAPLKHSTMPP